MLFEVCGGFKINRKPNKLGIFDKTFWDGLENQELRGACGCYLFAVQNGNNIRTWYVGKTEKKTFENECFQPTKINYYNEVLASNKGKPLLFLIARLTASGQKYSKPTKSGYRDVDFLETMIIGMALETNRDLMNVKKTALLRYMVVPGIINTPQGSPTGPVIAVKKALGLS